MNDKPRRRFQQIQPSNDWLDRLTRFNLHFGRYLRDVLGIFLVVSALLSLLSLWNITGGVLLTPWSSFLASWFGWGSYVLILAMAFTGLTLIRRATSRLGWGRILTLEIAALLTLGLLSILGGNSLVRAEDGQDGGRLGWGISYFLDRLIGPGWSGVILFFIWLIVVLTGIGFWSVLERWLMMVAGETSQTSQPQLIQKEDLSRPQIGSHKSASKNQPNRLPPEFRSSLKATDKKSERPLNPVPREEGLPSLNILLADQSVHADDRTINQTAGMIMKTLSEFGIPATVIGYRVGPTVTQFAVQPGFIKRPGAPEDDDAQQMKVRVAQIANLQKDLALALSAKRLRIEAPVPGKPYVGIEVPNPHSSVVRLRSILESDVFHRVSAPLAIALGRNVSGVPLVADLSRMPHILIAGATGSGKSVCITSLATCLAMNNPPDDLRMIMIDSKMVELLRFNGLPHLFGKVETNIERILGVLRWVVVEMEHRYRLLESAHARDLEAYNRKQVRKEAGKALPRIVVLIDELADLMMSAPDQTEHNLVRLAQMARATGIHLVVATQRPSTDVVTGLIKANFPARLAFAVGSGIDSRVILDTNGAETLLGHGDMLFLNPEMGNPFRAQGVMVTDMEIERVIDYWQKNSESPLDDVAPWEKLLNEPDENQDDGLIEQAISIVRGSGRASASLLQRRLRIGYPRAARLLDQLEETGVVGPSQGGGKEREVMPYEESEEES